MACVGDSYTGVHEARDILSTIYHIYNYNIETL